MRLRFKLTDHQIITSIVDTGQGISDKDIKRDFDEFYQVDTGSLSSNKGSGLGLTLSSRIN
ncbi:MAG: ATP-binding protein [Anaerolineae bacterium]|nr:ATP-binding protein [Anaerolineae bacterium]